ncbi:MAG: DAK2 domain-containing protein [Bacteroidales bacterium]|nr:DAK2 domain-containing protein [Bacteroidales bacterium]
MQHKNVQTYSLTGKLFLSMLSQGCARLGQNRQAVNDLNVFPIPDGDTGDNMCLTIESGYSQAAQLGGATLGEIAGAASSGMLMGARGNSGVILSRIFAGMAKGLTGVSKTNTAGFAAAMASAVQEAYGSVAHPVEGTMLTVVRESTESAEPLKKKSMEEYVGALVQGMETSLEHTPEKLQVLADAGVVDSGGAGLLHIFYGFQDALLGITNSVGTTPSAKAQTVDFSLFDENSELTFGYCTEFLLRLQSSKVDLATFDAKEIENYILGAGDSVVFFREGTIIKVHVHTKTPGDILSHCQKWGEFLTVKVENMTLQHHNSNLAQKPAKKKDYGVVTVASGSGLEEAFKNIGADFVVSGGQTMNPSVADFIAAFEKVPAKTIFVFPNNSNIIMTARQAAEVYADARVITIPTKDLGQGYVAIASLDTSLPDADAIASSAQEIAQTVVCGMVSPASRDTVMDGIEVRKGGHIGYKGDVVMSSADNRMDAALDLCKALDAGSRDVVLVFGGADSNEEEAADMCKRLGETYPSTEFIYTHGGQAVYHYTFILC